VEFWKEKETRVDKGVASFFFFLYQQGSKAGDGVFVEIFGDVYLARKKRENEP